MRSSLLELVSGLALLVGCASPQPRVTESYQNPSLTLTNEYFHASIQLTPEGTRKFMRYGPQEAQRQLKRALDEYTGDLTAPELKQYFQEINRRRTEEKLDTIRNVKPQRPDSL